MGFNQYQSSGGGDFRPIIKYDAKAGKMFRVDRFKDLAGKWDSQLVEITDACAFIADMPNIEIGWMAFDPQVKFEMVKYLDLQSGQTQYPVQPTGLDKYGNPAFKEAFRVGIKLANSALQNPTNGEAPEAVRDLSGSSAAIRNAFNAIVEAWEAAPERNDGLLPVVQMKGANPVKSAHGTNYQPVFEIVAWQPRPDDLPADGGRGGDTGQAVAQTQAQEPAQTQADFSAAPQGTQAAPAEAAPAPAADASEPLFS